MAQSVPCRDLESNCKLAKKPVPLPPIPECFPVDAPISIKLLFLSQLLAVLTLVVLVSICTIPSAYVYRYITI
jgi:hypothetical protein